jgi:hypothetical protein
MVITFVGGSLASQVSNSGSTTIASKSPQTTSASGSGSTAAQTVSSAPTSPVLQLSAFALQLTSSEALLTQRENTLSRSQLAAFATNTSEQLEGAAYEANRAAHDSEVPKTDDPQSLARAKLATQFVADAEKGGNSVKNPFSGLSDRQLDAVIYDDSGTYTVNERRAADYEVGNRNYAWEKQVTAQGVAEYNGSGILTDFFMAALSHYNALSPIRQSGYPANYADDLVSKIQSNHNYRTNTSGGDLPAFFGPSIVREKPRPGWLMISST